MAAASGSLYAQDYIIMRIMTPLDNAMVEKESPEIGLLMVFQFTP